MWREKLIDNCVIAYKKTWPIEYEAIKNSCKEIRKSRKNKFASDGDSDTMRWVLRLPRKLDELFKREWLRINKIPIIPDSQRLCNNEKEMKWFCQKYKEFQVPEKI